MTDNVRHSTAPTPVEGARWIPLTRGKFALVDEADYVWLSQRKWCAHKQIRKGVVYWYVIAATKKPKPYMHRLIVGASRGQLVDHKNGDGLDNRRENLRVATRAQNAMNRQPTRGRVVAKGVNQVGERWYAAITVRGRRKHLGSFASERAAAQAYDDAAKKHFGEFARVNEDTADVS
jgi:hypothetical protein